jgi:hypothetical protein
MIKFFLVSLLFFSINLTAHRLKAGELHPFDEISRNPQYQLQLKDIVQQAVAHNFGQGNTLPKNLPPPFEKPIGLFVTVTKNGKVLGCMGTIQPQQARLADEIFFNLQKAFSQDPRHHPISQHQLKDLEITLTAAANPQRVDNIDALNPARDSILLRHGAKEAVVLAGEARTLHYMLALAKSKAGIQPGDIFQIYRLFTKILIIYL